MKLNIATLALILVAAVVVTMRAMQLPWTPAHITGFAIAAPSFLLLVLARIQLGRAFSVQAKATALVTTGLYSRIRNPVYVFSALLIAGVIVWTGKLWFLLFFLIIIPMQVMRSRNEAKVLEEKFGDCLRGLQAANLVLILSRFRELEQASIHERYSRMKRKVKCTLFG